MPRLHPERGSRLPTQAPDGGWLCDMYAPPRRPRSPVEQMLDEIFESAINVARPADGAGVQPTEVEAVRSVVQRIEVRGDDDCTWLEASLVNQRSSQPAKGAYVRFEEPLPPHGAWRYYAKEDETLRKIVAAV